MAYARISASDQRLRVLPDGRLRGDTYWALSSAGVKRLLIRTYPHGPMAPKSRVGGTYPTKLTKD